MEPSRIQKPAEPRQNSKRIPKSTVDDGLKTKLPSEMPANSEKTKPSTSSLRTDLASVSEKLKKDKPRSTRELSMQLRESIKYKGHVSNKQNESYFGRIKNYYNTPKNDRKLGELVKVRYLLSFPI